MNHLCRENDTTGKNSETEIYFADVSWWCSLDDGERRTKIHFCPYCGVNLHLKQIYIKLESEGK